MNLTCVVHSSDVQSVQAGPYQSPTEVVRSHILVCFDHLFIFTSHNCIHCISNLHYHYYDYLSQDDKHSNKTSQRKVVLKVEHVPFLNAGEDVTFVSTCSSRSRFHRGHADATWILFTI